MNKQLLMAAIISKLFIKSMVVFISVILYSCEESTDYKFRPEELNFIVVNGIITNEKKPHEIIITHPIEKLNMETVPVSGVFVSVFDGDSLHRLNENPLNSGIYKTDTTFRAVINKTYTLLIITAQNRYYSTAYMLPVSPFNPLKYVFDESKQMYTIDSVTQAFNNNESAMYEISIDWTHISGYETIEEASKKATLYYYTLSTLDISEVFAPEKEKVYFPAGTIIVESKYSITPQHADFIRSMLLETEWRGGLFDVAHGNVKTNLSEGAMGYFATSTVIRDTIIVK